MRKLRNEKGQSLLELLLVLPLMLSLVLGLIRAGTIIQMAIVNQKYARAQALYITYNSPVYPRASFQEWFAPQGFSQMVIGVQNSVIGADEDGVSEENEQRASVYPITPKGVTIARGNGDDGSLQEQPSNRDLVRIRNTVSLCTPIFAVRTGGQFSKITPQNINTITGPDNVAFCASGTDQ